MRGKDQDAIGHPPSGLLLIDKPTGVSSFQVVDHVRRCFLRADPRLQNRGRRGKGGRPPRFKCGHAGTLDPLATGLLVVLVGKGSRLSHFLLGLDKSYAATVRFGEETDSLDSDGQVTETAPVPDDPAALAEALPRFRGDIQQVPPLISALKQDGQALYKKVRAGQEVTPPQPRPVSIRRLEVLQSRWPDRGALQPEYEADLVVECSSGTYIRSLARDLARAVGTVGHLRALRRLTVGPFRVEDALQDVLNLGSEELLAGMRPLGAALPQVPALVLDPDQRRRVRQGGQPEPDWLAALPFPPVAVGKAGPLFRLETPSGRLLAVGSLNEDGTPRLAAVIPQQIEDEENCG